MEGYVYTTVRAGTRPLASWYDPGREDNFLTSEAEWSGPVGTTRGGYTPFRTEGYVVNPPGGAYPEFGYETVTANRTSPFANPRPARGTRPLLVVLLGYQGTPVSHPRSSFEALFRGGPLGSSPVYPNVVDYFRENSYGQFTWSVASILSVLYPGTRAQAAAAGNPSIGATVVSRTASRGFDFCAYDRGFQDSSRSRKARRPTPLAAKPAPWQAWWWSDEASRRGGNVRRWLAAFDASCKEGQMRVLTRRTPGGVSAGDQAAEMERRTPDRNEPRKEEER